MERQNYKTVLWDIDAGKIDTVPEDFVLQRVLSYGPLGLIGAAIKENGRTTVQNVFAKMKPTAISSKKYNYLKNYLLA